LSFCGCQFFFECRDETTLKPPVKEDHPPGSRNPVEAWSAVDSLDRVPVTRLAQPFSRLVEHHHAGSWRRDRHWYVWRHWRDARQVPHLRRRHRDPHWRHRHPP